MINKKYFLFTILSVALISSGTTYLLTNKKNVSTKNEIKKMTDSISLLKKKFLTYENVIKHTNDFLSGKETQEINLSEVYDDSLLVATITGLNNQKTMLESPKTEYKVVLDTLVKIEKDRETEEELEKIKSELASIKEKASNPEKTKDIFNLVSSKGKKFQYIGEIQNQMANGYGEGIFETGSNYKGYWKNNLRHGIGKFTWEDNEYYEGSFANDKREGYGEYHWKNGEVYKGYWKNDMRHGNGKLYKKNGKLKKEGVWENDVLK